MYARAWYEHCGIVITYCSLAVLGLIFCHNTEQRPIQLLDAMVADLRCVVFTAVFELCVCVMLVVTCLRSYMAPSYAYVATPLGSPAEVNVIVLSGRISRADKLPFVTNDVLGYLGTAVACYGTSVCATIGVFVFVRYHAAT